MPRRMRSRVFSLHLCNERQRVAEEALGWGVIQLLRYELDARPVFVRFVHEYREVCLVTTEAIQRIGYHQAHASRTDGRSDLVECWAIEVCAGMCIFVDSKYAITVLRTVREATLFLGIEAGTILLIGTAYAAVDDSCHLIRNWWPRLTCHANFPSLVRRRDTCVP
jgi:hypothetical protein